VDAPPSSGDSEQPDARGLKMREQVRMVTAEDGADALVGDVGD
jgi:hypothetical protein